ncbi:hypothetical protein [Streptomyces zaomyceticus]|uniref:hypothetical protein n=1 Tax=Streptomyces zaomyceticus TaxID=68286 RepID=UPI00368395B7
MSGDSDRADVLLCGQVLAHQHLPYHHPADILRTLAPTQVIAMFDHVLHVGTPVPPTGLAPATQGVFTAAAAQDLRPTWLKGTVRHRMILDSPSRNGLSGAVEVGARSGRVLRAHITDRSTGKAFSASGPRAVRILIESLACPSQAAE